MINTREIMCQRLTVSLSPLRGSTKLLLSFPNMLQCAVMQTKWDFPINPYMRAWLWKVRWSTGSPSVSPFSRSFHSYNSLDEAEIHCGVCVSMASCNSLANSTFPKRTKVCLDCGCFPDSPSPSSATYSTITTLLSCTLALSPR